MKIRIRPLLITTTFFFCMMCPRVWAQELVIISPHWEGFRREFEQGFIEYVKEKRSQVVTIRWLDLGGASDINKTLIARKNSGSPIGFDILFGGGVDNFEDLKAQKIIKPAIVDNKLLSRIPNQIGGNPLWDTEHFWFGVNVTSFGIVFNKKLIMMLGKSFPTTYASLGETQFHGWIGSADPRKSGSVRFIYELILQKYGWDQGWQLIFRIASNIRSFNNNSTQTPKDLATGEILAGVLIDSYGLDTEQKFGADNIGFVVPQDVESFFADPVAVGSDSHETELANEFVEYCLSDQGQARLLLKKGATPEAPTQYEIGRLPVLPAVYGSINPHNAARSEHPFASADKSFTYNPAVAQKRWRIVTKLLGLIAVDLKDEIEKDRYKNPRVADVELYDSPCAVPISPTELDDLLAAIAQKQIQPLDVEKKLLLIKRNVSGCLNRTPQTIDQR